MVHIMPGKYLGAIGDGEVRREYSIELRPRGRYVLYGRPGPEGDCVPVDEGQGGVGLAEFCLGQGLDCASMQDLLDRVSPAMASGFREGLDRLAQVA